MAAGCQWELECGHNGWEAVHSELRAPGHIPSARAEGFTCFPTLFAPALLENEQMRDIARCE